MELCCKGALHRGQIQVRRKIGKRGWKEEALQSKAKTLIAKPFENYSLNIVCCTFNENIVLLNSNAKGNLFLLSRQVNKPEAASQLLDKAAKIVAESRPEDAIGQQWCRVVAGIIIKQTIEYKLTSSMMKNSITSLLYIKIIRGKFWITAILSQPSILKISLKVFNLYLESQEGRLFLDSIKTKNAYK